MTFSRSGSLMSRTVERMPSAISLWGVNMWVTILVGVLNTGCKQLTVTPVRLCGSVDRQHDLGQLRLAIGLHSVIASLGCAQTALLIMHVHLEIVARFGDPGLTERLAWAAEAGRAAGVSMIYVKVGFREGHPEISPRNRVFAPIAQGGGFVEGLSSELHLARAGRSRAMSCSPTAG